MYQDRNMTVVFHLFDVFELFICHLIKEEFFLECEGGKYGRNCMLDCGMCLNKEACDGVNGECQSGCAAGYSGETCNRKYQNLTSFIID